MQHPSRRGLRAAERIRANKRSTVQPNNSKTDRLRNRSKGKAPKLIVLRPSLMGLAVGFLWDMAARDVEAVHGDDVRAAVRNYLRHRIDAADEATLHGLAEPVGRTLLAAIAFLNSFENGVLQ
jgi:hypothetical protein